MNTRPFLCPRFVRNVPVVALIHQVAREVWHYETPWPIAVVGRYLLGPCWLRAYRDVPVVTVSESSRQSLAEYGLRRVTVVPEGWVPAFPAPVAKEPVPTVVFVGRLSANKRPEHAIAAFGLVRRQLPDAQMWVLGKRPAGGAAAQAGRSGRYLSRSRARGSQARAPGTRARPGRHVRPRGLGTRGHRGGRRARTVAMGYDVGGIEGLDRGVRRHPHPGRSGVLGRGPGRAAASGRRRLRTPGQGCRRHSVGRGRHRDPRRRAGCPVAGSKKTDDRQPRGAPLGRTRRQAGSAGRVASIIRAADVVCGATWEEVPRE